MAESHVADAVASPGLEWRDVTFAVRTGRGKKASEKVILDGVSGFAHKGEVTGIIGPSGSGKTTLMNILTGRVAPKCHVAGHIRFEDKLRSSDVWKWTVGYVEQFDLMYDSLTCWETLAFSAMTRLPRSYSTAQKLERAEAVLQTLNLDRVRDSRVGSEAKRGVSGGERKRVAVGCELVTSPKLLCLDECTSGLDSHSAYSVISTLQRISRLNVAVLCTIHQPSFELFSKFDRVILMALGRIAFHGTIPEAIAHFEKLGYPLPPGTNAADHFIALLTEPGNKESVSDEERDRVQRLLDIWSTTQEEKSRDEEKAEQKAEESALLNVNGQTQTATEDDDRRGFGLNYVQELYWLTKRAWVQQVRSPDNFKWGLSQSVFMAIILGFTFFRLGFSQSDVIGRAGLLFFIPIQNTFGVLFPIIVFLPMYNGILVRERRTGAYRVSTYLLSRYSVEIPVAVVSRLPFFVLIYWMCNFKPAAGPFFIFVAINALTVLLAITMGLFVGSLSTKLAIVQAIAPPMNVIFILFAGFLLPLPSIPDWFIWIHWISYATYVFAGLTINELKGLQFDCPPAPESQCYASGQQFLDVYGLERFTIAENVGLLVVVICAFAVLGYLKLRHLTRPRLRLD